MDSVYVVMPAYNEEDNIRGAVDSWYPVVEAVGGESKLVIADSGSVDNTHAILEELQQTHPRLEILADTGKQHGPKVIALYKYAIAQGATHIFQTDSDGQTNPAEFEAFWNARETYDAIIGHRAVRGDGKSRAMVEKVVCLLLRIIFGVKVPDANAPFRLMRADLVAKYIDRLWDDYNLPNIMMTTYFAYYKENIDFEEVSFKPRTAGVNSVNIPRIVKIGFHALGDFYRLKKGM